MKRIALFVFIAGILVLATACGGAVPTAPQVPTQPAATEVPVKQPAATDAPATGTNIQVDITLADNTIESSLTTFQVGVPYTFVITNAGRHAHNFNISTPVSVAGSLQNALTTALLAVDQNQLSAGASVTVEYTFPDSTAGANLELSCLIRRHYEDGMLLPIIVTS
jgi:uncharacterized cupredoxin-like copper-binding protein